MTQMRSPRRALTLLALSMTGVGCAAAETPRRPVAVRVPVVSAVSPTARAETATEAVERVDGYAVVRISDADLFGDAATVPRLAAAGEVLFDPGKHHETFRAGYGRDRVAARVAGGGIGRVRFPEGDDFALCGPADASNGDTRTPVRWERLVSDGTPGLAALQVTDGSLDRDHCRVEPMRSVSLPLQSFGWGTTYLLRRERVHAAPRAPLVLLLPRGDNLVVRGDLVVDRGAITYVFWPAAIDLDDPPSVDIEVAIADLDRWSLGLGPLPATDRPRTSAELAATPVIHVRVLPPAPADPATVRARLLVQEPWLERFDSRLGPTSAYPTR